MIPALVRYKTLLIAAGLVMLGAAISATTLLGTTTRTAPDTEIVALVDTNQSAGAGNRAPDEDEAATPDQLPGANATPAAVFAIIYISGAVQHPDVYKVPTAARVKDVVMAAGGLTEDAAADQINLADHVADAQHIHIPRQGETTAEQATTGADAPSDSNDGPLNINTASTADLDDLPGIGQSFAERIVEYRTTNGSFQSVEELQKVKGIGAALFGKIAPLVTVGP